MIWVAFCYKAKTPIVFISTTMKARNYISMLNSNLIPWANEVLPEGYIFQQDNAPCHRAKQTQDWFEEKGIDTLDWPARSPDLNPVENLFVILARQVYENGKQYETVKELENAIKDGWKMIEAKTLRDLINSMPKRMLKILESGKRH